MYKRTKIVCTMGPACDSDETIREMIKAGMNVARFNFSHGSYDEHHGRIERVRRISKELGMPVGILLDTKGPEVRTGLLVDGKKVAVKTGDKIVVTAQPTTEDFHGTAEHISLDYLALPSEVEKGSLILIDDGLVALEVESVSGQDMTCVVKNDGLIGERKGVNMPNVNISLPAITGADLDRMSDEELDAHIEDYGVYARVQPEHKTRIVEAWKSRDQIVAMTGDGVNDAPSIKRADIGVGMGITGTDVTKNVADMVLADDNFATIIGACEEGRRIYDNIRKVIQFLLSANLAEVFSVFIATLIGFTIFQPVQLLWVNLVTDCFPALALGMEDAEGDIMKRKPRNAKDGVFAGHMGLDCVVQGLIITALVLASFFVGVYFDMGYIHIADMIAGNADEEGVMMAFITLNMVEIFHCFNMRSRRASLFTMKKQNKWLWASAALALVLTVIVTVQPTLAEMFFGPVTLELKGVVAALGLAFLIIPLMEIYKAIMRAVEKE